MRNDQIKFLFEERLFNTLTNFEFWEISARCSSEEMNLFIDWLNSLDEDLVFNYLKVDISIFQFLNNQSDLLSEKIIRHNPLAFVYLKKQNNHLCELAVSGNPKCLKYVFEQTVDLCLLALKKDPYSYPYVKLVEGDCFETVLNKLKDKKEILETLK